MRKLFLMVLLLPSFTLWNCRDEAEEIVPTSVATHATKDSTQVVPPAEKPAATDSAIVKTDSTFTPTSGLDFSDSAYYQSAKNGTMPYRVMVPSKYNRNERYPLVIFLHGIDERGTDNEKQLRWGASLFKSDSVRRDFPAFVIFPQCPSEYYWASDAPMAALKLLISDFVKENNVNDRKIYIVGMSMGAYGTYEMVARNPDLFAAAIAISGDGDLNRAKNMARTQWKIYAGKKDNIVPSSSSERMASGLKASGAKVSLTVYPNANHVGSWVKAFEEPDFVSGLFSVSK
jgi:predicted peptidase